MRPAESSAAGDGAQGLSQDAARARHRHLDYCGPFLASLWILDIDTTVKPLYGHQEGAV
jgi:hypothetical protein